MVGLTTTIYNVSLTEGRLGLSMGFPGKCNCHSYFGIWLNYLQIVLQISKGLPKND